MKKFLLVVCVLALGFGSGISYRILKENKEDKTKERHYRIAKKTDPILGSKPFVILTMSYNNHPYVEKNLLSTLKQNYDNFRIVYVDDASTDGTADQVKQVLELYDQEEKVTFIQNQENQGAVSNLYKVIHECKSDEIIVLVDGDDFLAHGNVLSELNAYYANPDVWMTYGNFVEYPSYAKGKERKYGDARPLNLKILEERGVRKHAFVTSHLRTFYAGLFQRIKLQDLLHEGKFLSVGYDVASMMPMIELAGNHAYYIDDILYLYNIENPHSDFKERPKEQLLVEEAIRQKPSYAPLSDHPSLEFIHLDELVDLAVFSYNRPLQLYAFLESCQKYIEHLHRIFVVYRSENDRYEKGYQAVKEAFPEVTYLRQSDTTPFEDFAPLVRKAVFDKEMSMARFILFAVDDIIVKGKIDLKQGVEKLKQTGAYGFYYRLGRRVNYCYTQDLEQGIPPSLEIGKGIYAWQFLTGKGDWQYPNTVDMTLFRKEDIYPYFLCMKFHNPNILEALWNEHADLSQVGLYYEDAKIINLPLNIVMENEWINRASGQLTTKDLLHLWDEGYKMDITPFHEIDNRSAHIDNEPKFIKR
jgi:glycosyltransferase involved in cell wall biosynthesis